MRIHDITMPMNSRLPVWPGDTPFAHAYTATQAEGASANTGCITASLHAGTHADAPRHLDAAGPTIGQLDAALFVGPAIVVDVRGIEVIRPEHLDAAQVGGAPRVLLKTDAWADRSVLPTTWPAPSAELPEYLADRGVLLLGVDTPSVDAADATDLPVHRALLGRGIGILECLALDPIAPGRYELCALPLALTDGDGSPVRAVLIERQRPSC